MPSLITSDNGVSSGSAGLKTTAASDGILALQTTTVGGTATTAVTIDTSQNVGIGTSSPSNRLSVVSASGSDGFISISSPTTDTAGFSVNGGTDSNKGAIVRFQKGASTKWTMGTDSAIIGGTSDNFHLYSGGANAILFSTNASERMRLDASGRLLVGLTSWSAEDKFVVGPDTTGTVARLGLSGASGNNSVLGFFESTTRKAYINWSVSNVGLGVNAEAASSYVWFGTANTERARITSSGGLWVGTTTRQSTSNNIFVATTENDWVANFQANTSTAAFASGVLIRYNSVTPNSTGSLFFRMEDASANRAEFRSNGGLANFSANNANLSDARTKTDIEDAGSYLAKICAIPVRTFKYKDQTDDELNLGVIAQEVEAVAPELVDVSGFGETPEDGVPLKAIYQTDLQYALMKAIQELNAKVDAQAAEIAALKGTQP